MNNIGQIERITQNRVVKLFQEELGYTYLGNWKDRVGNSNIEEAWLTDYLFDRGYEMPVIKKAIFELKTIAGNFNDSLYTTNKNVYEKLRYGIRVKAEAGDNFQTVHLIDWDNYASNNFYIAEEVTI